MSPKKPSFSLPIVECLLMPLGRSHEISLPLEYVIVPEAGTYTMPANEERMELLPPGLVNFI